MSKYNDFVKNYESYDKFILFLLSLKDEDNTPYSVDRVAKLCEVSRQTIYNAIARNQETYDNLIAKDV